MIERSYDYVELHHGAKEIYKSSIKLSHVFQTYRQQLQGDFSSCNVCCICSRKYEWNYSQLQMRNV